MDISQSPSAEDDMYHSGQHGRFPLPDSCEGVVICTRTRPSCRRSAQTRHVQSVREMCGR